MKRIIKVCTLLVCCVVCLLCFSLISLSSEKPEMAEETTASILDTLLHDSTIAGFPGYRDYQTACERYCRESVIFSEFVRRQDASMVLEVAFENASYIEKDTIVFLEKCVDYTNSEKENSKLLAMCSGSAGGSDEQPYAYPVVPGSSAWKRLKNMSEMMKACQIPEEKAANMTTDALLASVLDYPLLPSYFTYDHPEDYCDLLMQNFNGLKELFSRKDVLKSLEEKRTAQNGDFIAEGNLRFIFDCYDYLSVRG